MLCAPWVVGTLLAGRSAVSVFGLAGSAATSPSWSDLLRFAVGPAGTSALSWLLVAAAILPLLIGRQSRLAWAGRFSAVAVLSWLLALAVAEGWTGSFAPTIDVLLAPAATAVAAGVGLGVASFEVDLAGYRFGWRQVATGLALLAAVVGLLPVVADAGDGRWGLADTGFTQTLSSLPGGGQAGGSRVLWLGDPRALPVGAWSVSAGLAYATTEVTTPDAATLWAPASPGPAAGLADAVRLAQQGLTAHLGRLLAPAAVRYVVVIEALAPQIPGVQTSPSMPPPPGLVTSLHQQADLAQVATSVGGLVVFENTTGLPQRAERTRPLPAAAGRPAGWPTAQDVTGWRPVLPGPPGLRSYSGTVTSGTVFASYAPAGRWRIRVHGLTVASTPAFGWAGQYENVPAGPATLRLGLTPLVPLAVIAELLLWLAVAGTLLGRRRWLDWWVGRVAARRARKAGDGEGGAEGGPVDPPRRRGRPRRRRRAIAVGGGPVTADGPRRPGNGRHSPAVRRLPVLVAVVASLVVAGLVDVAVSSTPAMPAAAPAASGAPVGAESSAWYCAGGSGTAGGPAGATLFLVNSADRPVGATLTVSASSGASAAETLTVPAFGQTTAVPSALVQGPWLATKVDVDGGGVTVSQLVHGAQGWSEAPCASTTAPTWYFASGSTANGNLLFVSVYNPGATMAVVDLTFATPGGVVAPQQFQGLVLAPGAVATAEVASFVQNQAWVAAEVQARAGQVVADELSVRQGAVSGLSLRLGSPSPEPVWYLAAHGGRDRGRHRAGDLQPHPRRRAGARRHPAALGPGRPRGPRGAAHIHLEPARPARSSGSRRTSTTPPR